MNTELTIEELQAKVANRPVCWREGQAAFNYLQYAAPELADKIRATNLDPFHRDERLPLFWKFVAIAIRFGQPE